MSSRFIDSTCVTEKNEKNSSLFDFDSPSWENNRKVKPELRIIYSKTEKPNKIGMQNVIKANNILQQARVLANKLDVEIEKTSDIKQILATISTKINKLRPESLNNQVKALKLSYYQVTYNSICHDSLDMLNF